MDLEEQAKECIQDARMYAEHGEYDWAVKAIQEANKHIGEINEWRKKDTCLCHLKKVMRLQQEVNETFYYVANLAVDEYLEKARYYAEGVSDDDKKLCRLSIRIVELFKNEAKRDVSAEVKDILHLSENGVYLN